jgi:hypothetical protein
MRVRIQGRFTGALVLGGTNETRKLFERFLGCDRLRFIP